MTLLVLLALLVSTPDGLPPKASPAPPVVTPPAPAAAPKVETNDRKPAAGASKAEYDFSRDRTMPGEPPCGPFCDCGCGGADRSEPVAQACKCLTAPGTVRKPLVVERSSKAPAGASCPIPTCHCTDNDGPCLCPDCARRCQQTATPEAIAPGPCGAERCLCKHGCEPGKCVGGCEGRGAPLPATDGDFRPTPAAPAAPAASFTIFGPDGKPLFSNAYVPPQPPPDDRQWHALGGQYVGWLGYGRKLPDGRIAVDWSCRAGTTDVRRGLPPLAAPPTYYRVPGFFGTPVSR